MTADHREPGPRRPTPSGLVPLVVARGAAAALVIAMPAALANVVLAAQTPKPGGLLNATFVLLLVGFGAGGWLAGSEAPDQRAKHGAVAAVVAFVPVQVVGTLGRLDRGDPVSIAGIVVVGLLAACTGTVGAQLGARRRARRSPS